MELGGNGLKPEIKGGFFKEMFAFVFGTQKGHSQSEDPLNQNPLSEIWE